MNPPNRIVVPLCSLVLLAVLGSVAYSESIKSWFAPPAPLEKLRIAVNTAYTMSGLVHIAAAKGFFATEGLEVTLQPHTSGSSALSAVIRNQAELATVADTPLMFAVTRKVPLAIVATIASATNSHGIVARRDRGVSAPADLKGKTVGVTLGTDAHFLLDVILARHGIAPADIKTFNIRPEEMADALSAGQVDAVAGWDPWLGGASKAAGADGVAFYPEQGFSFGFHVAGRRQYVQDHPAAMQKLLRSLLRAQRYLEEEPRAARAIIVAATKIDSASFDIVWPNFSLRLTLGQGLLTMLEDQARWAIASRYTDAIEVPNFLDTIYLNAMLAVNPDAVSIVR